MTARRILSERHLAIAAGALLASGTVLPWSTNIGFGSFVPGHYIRGTGSGKETFGAVLLPLGLLLIGTELFQLGDRRQTYVVTGSGAVALIAVFLHLALLLSLDMGTNVFIIISIGVAIVATVVLALARNSFGASNALSAWSITMAILVSSLLVGIHVVWSPYGVPETGLYVALLGGFVALFVGICRV